MLIINGTIVQLSNLTIARGEMARNYSNPWSIMSQARRENSRNIVARSLLTSKCQKKKLKRMIVLQKKFEEIVKL